jgi:hypothetical protein
MIEVDKSNFLSITGVDIDVFFQRILKGDSWGIFLKITSVLETSVKRAIGLKLGLDPNNKYLGKQEFANTLHLCFELNMITKVSFDFVFKLIEVRNKLVHTNGQLKLDVKELQGEKFYLDYKKRVSEYISIEGQDIENGENQHMNFLLTGCIGFVGEISANLFKDDWFKHLKKDN